MTHTNRDDVLGPSDIDDAMARARDGGGGRPKITDFEQLTTDPVEQLRIAGRNLDTAQVFVGPFETTVLERGDGYVVVELGALDRPVLDTVTLGDLPIDVEGEPPRPWNYWRERLAAYLTAEGQLSLTAVGPTGVHIVPGAIDPADLDFDFDVGDEADDEETWRTFSGSADPTAIVRPTGTGQRYLVLVCLPADRSVPNGKSRSSERSIVKAKVPSARTHWKEASLGDVSFDFDVYDRVIDLPEDWSHYYRVPAPARIDAESADYPVDVNGDTLTVESGDFDATVTFANDGLSPSDVVDRVNDELEDATAGEVPVKAWKNDDDQLRLETTTTGSDAEVSVTGGSAVETLGLSEGAEAEGEDGVHRIREVAETAVADRLTDDPSDAESILRQYDGVIVAEAMKEGDLRARASLGNWNLTIDLPGGDRASHEMGVVHITSRDESSTYAHEIGHNMGFPDLYDEPGPPELVGEELYNWDVMANSKRELHPSAWIKTWLSGRERVGENVQTHDPWVTQVEEVYRPASGESLDLPVEVILYPQTIPLPGSGEEPYADLYPDKPVVQAVRIHTSPETHTRDRDWTLYLEARENWEYSVNPFGSRTHHDDSIIGEGVVVTDAVNRLTDDNGNTDVPVHRANATFLKGPMSNAGDEWTRTFPGGDELTVRVEETIDGDPRYPGTFPDPTAYRLHITWGPGAGDGESEANLEIRPWNPPPWDSKDIWIDANWENEWDEYVHSDASENAEVDGHPVRNGDRAKVDQPSRLYARVYNHGPEAATNVRVEFSAKIPPGNQPGVPIGTDTINRIEPDEFGLARVVWTPATDNDEHVCVQASVLGADQVNNRHNNTAQENVTEWYLERGSPYQQVTQTLTVHNPLPRRTHCIVDVDGLRPGYHVDIKPASLWLGPDESREIEAVIRADDDVPLDADIRQTGREPPLVSVNYQLSYGCTWVPVNGVSGTVHTVRSTDVDARASFDGDIVEIVTETDTTGDDTDDTRGDGSASGATVTVTLSDDDDTVVASARTTADEDGTARLRVNLDEEEREVVTHGNVFVSATPSTGPAETRFRLDDRDRTQAK